MNEEPNTSKKMSQATWFTYIEAWEKSSKVQTQFCQENSLSIASFGY